MGQIVFFFQRDSMISRNAKQKRDFNREFKRGSFSRREINLINYAIERCRRILPPPWRLIDPKWLAITDPGDRKSRKQYFLCISWSSSRINHCHLALRRKCIAYRYCISWNVNSFDRYILLDKLNCSVGIDEPSCKWKGWNNDLNGDFFFFLIVVNQ